MEKYKKWIETEGVIGEEQSGFRKGRSGMENIYVLKEVIDRSRRRKQELYLGFIDIEKAYDGINRKKLLKLLEHIGMNEKIRNIITEMYTGNRMKFRLGEMETKWIDNNTEVQQGCIMSPTLFNLYIEELIIRIRKLEIGVKIGNKKLGCLGYAADLVLLAETPADMDR